MTFLVKRLYEYTDMAIGIMMPLNNYAGMEGFKRPDGGTSFISPPHSSHQMSWNWLNSAKYESRETPPLSFKGYECFLLYFHLSLSSFVNLNINPHLLHHLLDWIKVPSLLNPTYYFDFLVATRTEEHQSLSQNLNKIFCKNICQEKPVKNCTQSSNTILNKTDWWMLWNTGHWQIIFDKAISILKTPC